MSHILSMKSDFVSLFAPQKYAPIDGLRAISCLMIILLHIICFVNLFVPSYPSHEWAAYLHSYSFQFTPILGLSLETFFVLSGFLLTIKCVQDNYHLTWKGYLVYVIRRACRFWPGTLLATLLSIVLRNTEGNWISAWLFYGNYIDFSKMALAVGHLWSVSLDMQMHILIPIILYISAGSTSNQKRVYMTLYSLIMLSILYLYVVFNPETMNLQVIAVRSNIAASAMSQHSIDWIKDRYNATLAIKTAIESKGIKDFMENVYFPLGARYSSFLIGSIAAMNLVNTKNSRTLHIGQWRKYLYFTLVFLFMFALAIPLKENSPDPLSATIGALTVRQLFAASVAFILFSTICPRDHACHSSWIRSFLSLRIWTPIAKLSYAIYVLHLGIGFHFVMSNSTIFDPAKKSFDVQSLIWLALTFLICVVIGIVWYVVVEKPFERLMHRILPEKKKRNTN